MPTADELARTLAPRFDFQLKFYVGGKRDLANLADIAAGSGYDPTAATTLNGAVDADTTIITVHDTTGFMAAGVIVIAPSVIGEDYEAIKYASLTATSFEGLTRYTNALTGSSSTPQHADGATVSQWVDITALVAGNVTIGLQERNQIGTWDASLGGNGYNSRLIQQDAAALCLWRFRPTLEGQGAWTAWTVAFIGYIQNVTVDDSGLHEKKWNAQIEGLAQYLADSDCLPVYIGPQDLAEGKSVTVSSTLSDPWYERLSGEFVGLPSLAGANLVDDDMSTVWISQDVPAVTVHPTHANELRINEIFTVQRPGLPALQWFELYYKYVDPHDPAEEGPNDINHTYWVAACTNWTDNTTPASPEAGYLKGWAKNFDKDGQFLLIVSNKAEFERRWSVYGAEVLDWRDKEVGNFYLPQTHGYLCALSVLDWTSRDDVWWDRQPEGIGPDDITPVWLGVGVASPSAGNSMARTEPGDVHDIEHGYGSNASATAFGTDTNPTPGGFDRHDDEYASVDLGRMYHLLSTGLVVGATDHMHLYDVLGYAESGDVMIGTEIIGYASRNDADNTLDTLTRGKYGTEDEEHDPDADTVYAFENGITYDCYLVNALRWRRRRVMSGTVPVVPTAFTWYLSDDDVPIYPDDADWATNWRDYWHYSHFGTFDLGGIGDGLFLEHLVELDPPLRARHAMLVIHRMSGDGRAKMNQIHVYAPTQETKVGGDAGFMDGVTSGYAIKYLLVTLFGLDESQFTMTDKGVVFTRLNTSKARYLDVIGDILKRSGCSLYFGLDEQVEHKFSPGFALHAIDDIAITWDRDYARTIKVIRPKRHNVSQVILRAMDDSEEGMRFEVKYPPEPTSLGSVLTLEGLVLNANPTTALLVAQQIFRRKNGPLQAILTPIGPAEWVRPGQRHVIDWSLDTEGAMIADTNFTVTGVQYNVNLGTIDKPKSWTANVTLEELIF